MDRRKALKNISLTFGYAVATPTVLSILQSCNADIATWTPDFFTESQGYMVTQLADIILPVTDIAGALDVNTPQFMDKMLHDIAPDDEKNTIKEGANAFASAFQNVFEKTASEGSKKEYQQLLETYFNISDDKKDAIFEMMDNESSLSETQLETVLIYKFLIATRRYTLWGYYTSEHVGENILSYDPIPGEWEPCIPLEDVGNSWSL